MTVSFASDAIEFELLKGSLDRTELTNIDLVVIQIYIIQKGDNGDRINRYKLLHDLRFKDFKVSFSLVNWTTL